MKQEYRELRLDQLDRTVAPLLSTTMPPRPNKGWLRAIREATGFKVREIAERLKRAQSVVIEMEQREAEDRITLGTLREAADALGCRLVYVLVPKEGTFRQLSESRARDIATHNVQAVEHTMALEDQAVGDVDRKIEQETKRILRGRK